MPNSSSPPLKVTIGLFWHSMNSDNLGVGALTLANIEILRRAARTAGREAHFLILGWRDPRPDYLTAPDIEHRPFRTRHLMRPGGQVAADIARCDIVFDIGGGDSFTDIYGFKRFLTIWLSKARSLAAGKPLVLSPQTVGPFDKWWSPPLARAVMNRAAFVTSRDAPSTAFLGKLGLQAEILETTDVAMGLPYTPPALREDGKIRVGLNVSGLLFNGGYTQSNQFGLKGDYPGLIREIVSRFSTREGVELHLVGHVQSEHIAVEDDQRVSAELAKEFPGTVLAPVFASPIEAKSYIAGMDFFMGARMHATIAAFSSGVPVVPMAYSRKFAGVFGTLGYDHVADCKTDSNDEILARIEAGFADRDRLAQEMAQAMRGVDARLGAYEARAAQAIAALSATSPRRA
ncbi:polysaccharide pyruvyl transferase family protein [Limimaricola litoreus]|uniref:Polysaccharide pyruvyl transferase family protein n=1 Tax=Limimaricola litoreus TaxID=2955316 RepID=A0A9X2JR43_9RHOB|nr:polysaccharide pyruvyl transferase family protein [Limimaricola litoreus]